MSPSTLATISFRTGAILGFMPKFKALIALIVWDCLFPMYQVRRVYKFIDYKLIVWWKCLSRSPLLTLGTVAVL